MSIAWWHRFSARTGHGPRRRRRRGRHDHPGGLRLPGAVLPVLSRIEVQLCAAVPGFPYVVKVVSLSASQGVLRADDAAQAVQAATRIRCVLAAARPRPAEPLLVEEYLPG